MTVGWRIWSLFSLKKSSVDARKHNPSFFSAVIIVISVGWVFDLRATNDRFPSLPNRRRTRNSPGEKAKEKKKKYSVCCLSGRLVLSTTYRWPISLGQGYSFFPDSERGEIFEFVHLSRSVFEKDSQKSSVRKRKYEGERRCDRMEKEKEKRKTLFSASSVPSPPSSFLPSLPSILWYFIHFCLRRQKNLLRRLDIRQILKISFLKYHLNTFGLLSGLFGNLIGDFKANSAPYLLPPQYRNKRLLPFHNSPWRKEI